MFRAVNPSPVCLTPACPHSEDDDELDVEFVGNGDEEEEDDDEEEDDGEIDEE